MSVHPGLEIVLYQLRAVADLLDENKISKEEAEIEAGKRVFQKLKEGCPNGEFLVNVRCSPVFGEWRMMPEVIGGNPEAVAYLESLGLERPYADVEAEGFDAYERNWIGKEAS